jgi:hypothetical protein
MRESDKIAINQSTSGQVIETRTAKVHLREDGIIQSDTFPNAEISLGDAIDNTSAGKQISEGIKRPVLVNLGQVKSLSREARIYFGSDEVEKTSSAIALVVSSPIGRVIGNFMMGLNRTPYPTRLFTSEDEAVQWLKGFLK